MSFRLHHDNPFGIRNKFEQKEFNKKVLIFTEGAKTEQKYLVDFFKVHHRISSEVFVIDRTFTEMGNSHPLKIANRIAEVLDYSKDVSKKNINSLKLYHSKVVSKTISSSELSELIQLLDTLGDKLFKNNDHFFGQLDSIILLNQFEKDLDEIIIIVDRDKESFTEKQYDEVISICQSNNFTLVVSNPCIEFYFLLHFSDLKDIVEDELLENCKEGNNTFVENMLKEEFISIGKTYSKNNFESKELIDRFHNARENIQNFESDIVKLKYSVGTNLVQVICDLIND